METRRVLLDITSTKSCSESYLAGKMLSWVRQLPPCCLLAAALFLETAFGQVESKFDVCKLRLDRILNGTETFRGIDNQTIANFLYRGPVRGMNPQYAQKSRDKFITLTTPGMSCRWTLTTSSIPPGGSS